MKTSRPLSGSTALNHTARMVAVIGGLLVAADSGQAQYSLIEDFESYTLGNFNAGGTTATNVWTSNTGGGTGLVAVETDGVTQYLAQGWNTGQRGAWRATTAITEGSVGTYYWQMRTADATPDVSYGLSDVAAPTAFGDFEVQVALVTSGGAPALGARNGGAFQIFVTGLSANTWYDVWVAVDNATDTYSVWYGTTGDPNTLGTPVASDLAFRNGTTSDLNRFWTLSNNHGDRQAHLDNIYSNPVLVPEPGTATLLLGGVALLLGYRRTRKA